MLWLFFLAVRTALAGWEFTTPADPNRSWSINATSGGSYDDNINASEKDRQSGLRSTSAIKFRASVPFERFLMGVQYEYDVDYPRDINLGGYDETHNLSVAANYVFNPRLTLNINENFVNSLQPELVLGPANAPITVIQAGTYVYNNIGGGLSFSLTPRWVLSASGSWDIWRYQVPSVADSNDHVDYSTTLSALYSVDPRTIIGLNYQYGQDVFSNPGFNNGRNASADTGYLSIVRRLNPQLSLSVNGGYTIRQSEDGSTSTSPTGYASLVYNYGLESTLALTFAESLSEASLQGTRQYSSQESTSFSLQAQRRLTVRLSVSADLTYTRTAFSAPLAPGVTLKPTEEALTGGVSVNYAFRDWVSAVLGYAYTQLMSSDSNLIQPYDRDRISLGISLTY